jgi:tetratricopeptide (TPR) repeat protein
MLLEHDEVDKVEKLMEKLEEAAPVAKLPDGNITARLKTSWLVKQQKTEEAIEFAKSLISEPVEPEQVARLGMVVRMLEDLKDYADAEKFMRQWYEADPTQTVALGAFLGRRGKVDEAFTLFETAREKQPSPNVFVAALETLHLNSDKPAPAQTKMLEQWLLKAIEDADDALDAVRLKLLLVEVQDLEQRYGDSIKLYRSLLAGSDLNEQQRAVVQNNLAFMLVTRGTAKDVAEAQTLIDEAVARLGPLPGVLDTRGLIRLAEGNAKLALTDFKTAVTESPTAVNFFHLALAEDKMGNAAGANNALEKAAELKLDLKLLSPGEKRDYKRLHKNSAKPGKG